MPRVLLRLLGVVLGFVVAVYVVFHVSPWPGAMLIRQAFTADALRISRSLEKHVPTGVSAQLNLRYDAASKDCLLDVFYPSGADSAARSLPTVIWIHGGGWVSGSKGEIANYARILASKGCTVVGVDYSVAPGKKYPTPIRQVNEALKYLEANATRLHVDSTLLVLAGDSGGAHIAAQLANAIVDPSYARSLGLLPSIDRSQLAGMILYCGAFDVRHLDLMGPFGGFLKAVLWAYSGKRDFMTNPEFATASVIEYVSRDFPPAFISVGNGDPLEPQSHAFADTLAAHGVPVDSLFFPHDQLPALPHEYQFNLDTKPGWFALERSVQFLAARGHHQPAAE